MESIGRDTMTVAEKEYLAMEKKKARLQKQRLVLLENEHVLVVPPDNEGRDTAHESYHNFSEQHF